MPSEETQDRIEQLEALVEQLTTDRQKLRRENRDLKALVEQLTDERASRAA